MKRAKDAGRKGRGWHIGLMGGYKEEKPEIKEETPVKTEKQKGNERAEEHAAPIKEKEKREVTEISDSKDSKAL